MIRRLFGSIGQKDLFDRAHLQEHLMRTIQSFNAELPAPEVLFLGDSSLERISREDRDKRSVDQILGSHLQGKLRVACISGTGYHTKLFSYVLRAIQKAKQRPKIVILPINMRMFSPQWDLNPLWQYEEETEILKQYIENPGAVRTTVNKTSPSRASFESYDAAPVSYPLSALNRIGQFSGIIHSNSGTQEEKQVRLRHLFIFHYTHPLQADHPKVAFLEDALSVLSEMSAKSLVYVTPINYQAGEKYVGGDFVKILDSNVSIVAKLAQSYRFGEPRVFVDCSKLLSSEYFFHEDCSTEHLNQGGRALLAQTIAARLVEFEHADLGFKLKIQGART